MLQITDLYPPVGGGLELSVQALSRELARRGHEVVVATQPTARRSGAADDGVRIIEMAGWARRLLRGSYENPAAGLQPPVPDPAIVRRVQNIIDDFLPDVVHVHGWIAQSVLAVRSFRGAAVVVGVHDYGLVCANKTLMRDGAPCDGPSLGRCPGCAARHYGPAKGVALYAGLRACTPLLRRAHGFIVNSQAVADASRRVLPRGAALAVIAPATDHYGASSERPAFLPAADGFVLFVGALGAHKGLGVLLDAFERFGLGAELVVIGARLPDTPARFPLGVSVGEGVDHAHVMAAWRHSAVGVVPSLWPEPFGMVAVEAMAAGRPVVASDTGGLREIVADGVTGILVRPGDPRALARAIRQLVDDPARRATMGAAAQTRARAFDLETTVTEVERFYRSLRRG